MSKKTTRKMIAALLCAVLVASSAVIASADSSLLTPGTSRITAGSSFDFTLDLSSVIKEAEDKESGTLNDFVVALTVSSPVSALSVSEGVGNVSANTGEYQVNSSKLGDHKTLHFNVTPANVEKETTYQVAVSVTGSVSASDSFTFIVTPTQKPGSDDKKDDNNKDKEDKEDTDDNDSNEKGKLPSGKGSLPSGAKKSGGSVSSGSSGGSSKTVYAGSWDNYLDSLSVEGFEFTRKFSKIRDTYFMTVPLDTTDITVSASASDSSAIVAVTGTSDLPEGRSKVMISVTADDGSVRIYRIYVDRVNNNAGGNAGSSDGSEV